MADHFLAGAIIVGVPVAIIVILILLMHIFGGED